MMHNSYKSSKAINMRSTCRRSSINEHVDSSSAGTQEALVRMTVVLWERALQNVQHCVFRKLSWLGGPTRLMLQKSTKLNASVPKTTRFRCIGNLAHGVWPLFAVLRLVS
jgi:hypothetical protein